MYHIRYSKLIAEEKIVAMGHTIIIQCSKFFYWFKIFILDRVESFSFFSYGNYSVQ